MQGEGETLLVEFSSADGTALTLDTGVWNFTLKGYKDEVLILIGTIAERTITEGNNTLLFTVEPTAFGEGKGTIALTVELPARSGITEARVFKDGELYTSLEPVDNKVIFEESTFNAGFYYFSIRLYKDGKLYGVVSEMVLVWANLRSEKTYTVANEDLNLTYIITYHFGDGETETDYYQYTDTVTFPTPSHPGYAFKGWYENADFSGNAVFTIPSSSTTGDKDFYAWWADMVDTPSDLSLAESLAWISANVEAGGAYSITLKADEVLAPTELSYGVDNVSIVIDGGTTEKVISLDSTGSLFSVGDRVTLTMGNNVTLQGRSDNTDSLVWVGEGGMLVMNGGSKISGNTVTSSSSSYGGGVYVGNSGRFTMDGGEISDNTTSDYYRGGGVYVDSSGTFTMNAGAKISDNTGRGVSNSGMFTMNGGEISGNTASAGGGVYSSGMFTMNAGEVSGNSAASGGGVYVSWDGMFTMNAGEVSNNTASGNFSYGGGVYVHYSGTFMMNGGEISGNSGGYLGGGVYVYDSGTFTMSDGEISGNTARGGGGVYVDSSGTFTMNGGEISGNSGSGVDNSGTFTMSGGEISGNSGSGVYVGNSGTFEMSGGEVSGNTASSSSGGGVYVGGTFEMNGGEISGNTITSSYSASGGGVSVESSGTFTMNGGEISGNTITSSYSASGGGVYVESSGTFTMSGGEISGNTASFSFNNYDYYVSSGGGGVYVGGTFEMNGGEISGNTASSSSGGGVYVDYSGTFTKQSGGTIYGLNADASLRNTATNGHAVYANGKVRNNTASVGVTLNSAVSGADGGWETILGYLQIDFNDPQLSGVSLSVNQSYSFNTGTDYASWTWYWDGELISGATSSSYTLTPDKSRTPGIYELSVVVINNAGEKLSARCRVTVNAH
jgi:uncharacterized repeat protein (TIGR02543 family)